MTILRIKGEMEVYYWTKYTDIIYITIVLIRIRRGNGNTLLKKYCVLPGINEC